MGKNAKLTNAKRNRNDEFYTRMENICDELQYYTEYFKDKTVYCNCDNPYESNFFKYFVLNFNILGLKKLICTCWDGTVAKGEQMDLFGSTTQQTRKTAYKIELTRIGNLSDVEDILKTNKPTVLKGNGDFRSDECVELLKESDIIVTNPPFSLFNDYFALLMKHQKKFLVVANKNAVKYKSVFPSIMGGGVWTGTKFGDMEFLTPTQGERKSVPAIWLTNLDHKKRHKPLGLYKRYATEEYPQYDNYDAIEVSHATDIPVDYDGMMGVPISFLGKYCPEQFEIVGIAHRGVGDPSLRTKVYTKEHYANWSDLNAGPVLKIGNEMKILYPRILIRHKNLL